MNRLVRPGDRVFCPKIGTGVFEVTRKRTGVNMYEIAKVLERYSDGVPRVVCDQHDGLLAEELTLVDPSR